MAFVVFGFFFGVDKIEHSLGHWRIVHHLIASQLNNVLSPFRLPLPPLPCLFPTQKGCTHVEIGSGCAVRASSQSYAFDRAHGSASVQNLCSVSQMSKYLRGLLPRVSFSRHHRVGGDLLRLHIFTDSAPEHPQAQTTSREMMPTTMVDVEKAALKTGGNGFKMSAGRSFLTRSLAVGLRFSVPLQKRAALRETADWQP